MRIIHDINHSQDSCRTWMMHQGTATSVLVRPVATGKNRIVIGCKNLIFNRGMMGSLKSIDLKNLWAISSLLCFTLSVG